MSPLLVLAESAHWITPKAWFYAGFIALICMFLALDLGVFHRKAHVVSMKEAIAWTIVWVIAAMAFNFWIYFAYQNHWLGIGLNVPQLDGTTRDVHGFEAAKLYLTGYIVEKSLAMDNVFVIAMIFSYFAVPAIYQHRVLFWGIIGALLMRGFMIALGAALIYRFSWIIYVFGGFLILTALKMALIKSHGIDPEKNPLVRLVRRIYPVTTQYDGQRFFTRINGVRTATPLFLALVMVEFTDLIFAVDSIPAIFAITADPFIVFTSNIFAILGLRAMYFCLANLIDRFRYLKPALIAILFFVGVKMMLVHTPFKISPTASLGVVVAMIATGVVASLLSRPKPSASESVELARGS
ncbi:MAG: TerC family protein [Phycisphaeraceae bacterium]|nr:TerC family protein [Phycisphaeraceae bacterium]